MKKKLVSILLAAVMSVTAMGSVSVWAADAAVTEAPAEENTESTEQTAEGAEQEEKVIEDVKVTLESGEVTIKNETETNYTAEYEKQETAEEQETDAVAEEAWNLVLTDEEGNTHTFEKVTPDKWTELSVIEEYGFLYIKYKDADGKEQETLETAEEKAFEKELTMYVTTDVNVRKEASKESKSLKVTSLGAEWKAVASVPGWIKVEAEGISGYVFHSYITEDKEKVDALVQEKKAAAAQAAAQAAQAQASYEEPVYQEPVQQPAEPVEQPAQAEPAPVEEPEPAPEEPAPAEPSEPVEVSRQAYDDCDGSGHGYYEIIYSDGSVAYEEY